MNKCQYDVWVLLKICPEFEILRGLSPLKISMRDQSKLYLVDGMTVRSTIVAQISQFETHVDSTTFAYDSTGQNYSDVSIHKTVS